MEHLLRYKRLLGITVVLVLAAIISMLIINRPHRSIANYCSTYTALNKKMSDTTGETYSVKVFSHSSNDPKVFVNAFARLDKVAPKEIEPDVNSLEKVFETISSDPAANFSASLSGLSAEDSVTQWTKKHCT